MADRDAVLRRPARRFYDSRTDQERLHLARIIAGLCFDPSADDVLKFRLPIEPDEPLYYRDDAFYVVYAEENNWRLAIWDIGYTTGDVSIGERPTS